MKKRIADYVQQTTLKEKKETAVKTEAKKSKLKGEQSHVKKKPASPIKNLKPAISNRQYSFFENVYDVARLIPKGRVTSYGAIAKYLGSGKSARMVGYAMNSCGTQLPPVPAHRVLNRNGMLTGKHHFSPPILMQKLLEKEGVMVKKDTVVNLEKVFWDPSKEL